MTDSTSYEIAIIGGGVVGLATAMALSTQPGPKGGVRQPIIVLEAENRLAAHQTGNNSGVIHSGIYYKPGSLKARNCVEGRLALYQFCEEHNITHEHCGKVIIATSESELPRLDNLEQRGHANGLEGLRRLSPEEIKEYEPHAVGLAGLYVPQTGIVNYTQVCEAYADIIQKAGGSICTNSRVLSSKKTNDGFALETAQGPIQARNLINCAGLQSDRVARLCGVDPGLQIIPFRGEYYELSPESRSLVKNLLYPVPDPRFPFLGAHFTRMVKGGVEIGPNAVLAFKREGYRLSDISIRDMVQYGFYVGFWRMAFKYWKMGLTEFYRSFSKRAYWRTLQRMVPDLQFTDIHRTGSGVRAQALTPNGELVDDFRIVEAERMIHVLNAPSPAATASISIGRAIAGMAVKNFSLAD